MKALPFILALLCASCATKDQVANDGDYRPPVYRTGSNLPSQGHVSGSNDPTSVSGEDLRRALPPPMTPKPASN